MFLSRYAIIGLAVLFVLNLIWVAVAVAQPRARRKVSSIAGSIISLIVLSWITTKLLN